MTRLSAPGVNHLALSGDGLILAVACDDFSVKLVLFADAEAWEKSEVNLEGELMSTQAFWRPF